MSSRSVAAWTLSLMLVAQLGASKLALAAQDPLPPTPEAPSFQLSDLSGSWYEIARLGKVKNHLCSDATASFSIDEGTPHSLVTSFDRTCPAGGHAKLEGITAVTDAAHPSRLAFTYKILGINTEEQLNVIDLNQDVGYVVIGNDARTTLYIYSRTPGLGIDTLGAIINLANSDWGYENVAKDMSCTKQAGASEEDYTHCNNLTG